MPREVTPLFRPEVDPRQDDAYGEMVGWSSPAIRRVATLFGVVCVAGLVALLLLKYSQKLPLRGVVRGDPPPVVVYPTQAGRVLEINVADGDRVKAGGVLVRVDLRERFAGARSGSSIARHALSQRTRSLERERVVLNQLHEARSAHLASRELGLMLRLRQGEQRIRLAQDRQRFATSRTKANEQLLARGAVSQMVLEQARLDELGARQSVLMLAEKRAIIRDEQRAIAAEQEMRALEHALQRGRVDRDLAGERSELDALSSLDELVVTAPVDGIATNLLAGVGEYVAPDMPLLTVVESEAKHSVLLQVPARAAARVVPEMGVKLRYAGAPVEDQGLVSGRVATVGHTAIGGRKGSYLLVRVVVDDPPLFVAAIPNGVEVEADVTVETKPVWQWLAAPVQRSIARL